MTRILLIGALLTVILQSGCRVEEPVESKGPETPAEAVQAIIQLYEAQDFDTLIRTRYAEISKAENEEQIQVLVSRFEGRLANEQMRNQALDLYRSLLSKSPEMSDDGTVATYMLDNGFVKLSRMADGRWGFHM